MPPSSTPSFAIYPSLRDASVIVTGGASGIGMEIVRAFAGQSSKVGFLDFDLEHGRGGRRRTAGIGLATRHGE